MWCKFRLNGSFCAVSVSVLPAVACLFVLGAGCSATQDPLNHNKRVQPREVIAEKSVLHLTQWLVERGLSSLPKKEIEIPYRAWRNPGHCVTTVRGLLKSGEDQLKIRGVQYLADDPSFTAKVEANTGKLFLGPGFVRAALVAPAWALGILVHEFAHGDDLSLHGERTPCFSPFREDLRFLSELRAEKARAAFHRNVAWVSLNDGPADQGETVPYVEPLGVRSFQHSQYLEWRLRSLGRLASVEETEFLFPMDERYSAHGMPLSQLVRDHAWNFEDQYASPEYLNSLLAAAEADRVRSIFYESEIVTYLESIAEAWKRELERVSGDRVIPPLASLGAHQRMDVLYERTSILMGWLAESNATHLPKGAGFRLRIAPVVVYLVNSLEHDIPRVLADLDQQESHGDVLGRGDPRFVESAYEPWLSSRGLSVEDVLQELKLLRVLAAFGSDPSDDFSSDIEVSR